MQRYTGCIKFSSSRLAVSNYQTNNNNAIDLKLY